MTEAVLQANELYRFYRAGDEETLALRGVSLAVEAGEFVAVTGPSGSGKSTLLACMAALDEPDGGAVRVSGIRISHRPQAERTSLRARLVGMLFQSGNLLEHLTVRANIDLAQRLAGRRDSGRRDALLEELGLADRDRSRPAQLSGGEAARAGLAVALANRPAVLLADEPTGELDRRTEDRVLGLLRRQAEHGAAVVVASHSPAVAAAADRTITLEDGRRT
ncbi:ABC transporter ATP-binding protein [Actinomadura mexicana]|uniref:Putative ABC transport system ATP-binding protein n=1 Tax=Actinomadura mexicana TaxID=134959 RepID=A0A238UYI4_9ACTN|nr:ABC transporter ATP-binding protein [Actinomadura mexicana]SNR27270.1 putative ABC transport system ATP-binding protein [Actinomadura mexicana]